MFATEHKKKVDKKRGIWEDGIYASALIASLLSEDRGALGRILQETQWRYRQTNLKSTVRLDALAARAREALRRFKVAEERDLDGLKFVLGDGSWIMFRPSGTEPITRIYCESKDPQQVDVLTQVGIQCVEASNTS